MMLDYLTKHFLVLSTITLGVSSALSMLMLSAYLSVFDWTLIWLVEYTDLAKLFLIGTALFSSISIIAYYQMQSAYDLFVKKIPHRNWFIALFFLLYLATSGFVIYTDYISNSALLGYHVLKTLCWGYFGFLVFFAFLHVPDWKQRKWTIIGNDLAMLFGFLGLVGITFAYYVRDASQYTHVISTKTDTFSKARIVMMLSHHAVFLTGKDVVVVPAADVIKIQTDSGT